MEKTLAEICTELARPMRALEKSWTLPPSLILNRVEDVGLMADTLERMAVEASPISPQDGQELAKLLKDVGIPYKWLFDRYKVSRAGELAKAQLTHIQENIQRMADEYRKETVTA